MAATHTLSVSLSGMLSVTVALVAAVGGGALAQRGVHAGKKGWLHHDAAAPNLVQKLRAQNPTAPNPDGDGQLLLLLLAVVAVLAWCGNRHGICCTTARRGARRAVGAPARPLAGSAASRLGR